MAFLDGTHLSPPSITPKRPGLLGRFDVLGTVHLMSGAVLARALSDRLHALLQGQGEILGGASELPAGRGATVRILGPRVEPVAAALQAVLAAARATLLGTPERRAADTAASPSPTASS